METNNAAKISLPWYEVWTNALIRPSVIVYENFLQDIHATPKRAYIWLIVSGIIGGIVSAFAQPPPRGISPIILATCNAPFLAIVVVFSIIVIVWLIQSMAQILGGTGTYSKLVYAFATFNAPMTIISSSLLLIPSGLWINAAVGIYWAILSAIAVKAVHQLEWRKVFIAILPIILLTIMLIVVTPSLIRLSASVE